MKLPSVVWFMKLPSVVRFMKLPSVVKFSVVRLAAVRFPGQGWVSTWLGLFKFKLVMNDKRIKIANFSFVFIEHFS